MSSFNEAVAAGWDNADPDTPATTVDHFRDLLDRHPGDPQAIFEYASALDFAEREAEAAAEYERAFAAGLSGDTLRQGLIQYGSTLRNLGRHGEAISTLRRAAEQFPGSGAATAFLALALASGGKGNEAVAELINLALDRVEDAELRQYRRPLRAYAVELTEADPA